MNWNQIKRKSGGEREKERKKDINRLENKQTNKKEMIIYILFIEDSNYSIAKKIGLKTDNFENKLKNSIQMHPCISFFFFSSTSPLQLIPLSEQKQKLWERKNENI